MCISTLRTFADFWSALKIVILRMYNNSKDKIMSDLNITGSDLIHVEAYTRDDGTEVKEHYRHKKGGSFKNATMKIPSEYKELNTLMGGVSKSAENPELPPVIEGGIEWLEIPAWVYAVGGVLAAALGLSIPTTIGGGVSAGALSGAVTASAASSSIPTAITALNQAQAMHGSYLNGLVKELGATNDKELYPKLYEEYTKQKAYFDKTQKTLDKINYANEQKDTQTVSQEVQNLLSEEPPKPVEQPIEEHQTDIQQGLEKLSESSFDKNNVPRPNLSNYENTEQYTKAKENLAKTFEPIIKTTEQIAEKSNSVLEAVIKASSKETINTKLISKPGKMSLDIVNQFLNKSAKDAADLMQISIYGPENLLPTSDYMPIDKSFNEMLNKDLSLKDLGIEIPEDWYGIVFEQDSHLAQTLNQSEELKKIFEDELKRNKSKNYFLINLNADYNIKMSIHGATILKPQDNGNYYTGLLFDKYDFALMDIAKENTTTAKNKIINNIAYLLQETDILNNYYILMRIKIPK